MGNDGSYFKVSLIVRNKVTRQCCWLVQCSFTSTETVGLLGRGAEDGHLDFHKVPELWRQLWIFEEREKPERNLTEALLLTSLAPCRYAKPAPTSCLPLYSNILCCSLGPLPTRTEWYWQARKHAEAGSPLDRPELQRPHPWMCQQHIDRPGLN